MSRKRNLKRTTEGTEILKRRYLENRPERAALLARVRADDAIGRKIFQLRVDAGLTQKELAKLIGTSTSAICRLEDADYKGHSFAMLNRIATALNKEVRIEFVSKKRAA